MARPIDLRKVPGLNLSKPGKPIDLSKPHLQPQTREGFLPVLSPVDEYTDIFAPNQQAYSSNPAAVIYDYLTPLGLAETLIEEGVETGNAIDNLSEAWGGGRPIGEINRLREEAIANLDPDAQLQLEKLNPINRLEALGEAVGDMNTGFGRNKDGQVCWFVSPHLSTGYAVCTPPKPKPEPQKDYTVPGLPGETNKNEEEPPDVPPGCSGHIYGFTLTLLPYNGDGSVNYNAKATRLNKYYSDWINPDENSTMGLHKWFYGSTAVTGNTPASLQDGGFLFSTTISGLNTHGYGIYAGWFITDVRYVYWGYGASTDRAKLAKSMSNIPRHKAVIICSGQVYDPPASSNNDGQYPPHQEDIIMEQCCEESLEILKLIARWTGATKQRALRLPNTILEPQAEDSPYADVYKEALGDSPTVDIENLSDLSIYLLQQISTLTGSFPFEVDVPKKIQEASKRANEPVPAKIPVFSLSGGIQQLLNLAINTQDDESRLADLIVRSVSEAYIARQQATLAYLYLKTLFDWLNIETDDATIELPTLISFPNPENPPDTEDELLEFVKPSKIEIKYPELKDKGKDLTDLMYPVVEAAQMIRTKWGQRIPKDNQRGMTEELILNWATMLGYDGAKELIKRVQKKRNNPDAPPDADKEDSDDDKEWRELITQIEQGFSTQGVKNPDKPYGRNPAQRPRIRTINDSQVEVR